MEDKRDIIEVDVPQVVDEQEGGDDAPKGKYGALTSAEDSVRRLTGMYKNWFLD